MNQVGNVQLDKIQPFIDEIMSAWKAYQVDAKNATESVVEFLIKATDYLIRSIEPLIPIGIDKKATVLSAFSNLYDEIVPSILPIFLKPFNSYIKNFIVNVLVSAMIDYIVSKYNNGMWSVPTVITTSGTSDASDTATGNSATK